MGARRTGGECAQVSLYEVDRAVAEKADWIVKKLGEVQNHHARLESARIEWRNGALSFFG